MWTRDYAKTLAQRASKMNRIIYIILAFCLLFIVASCKKEMTVPEPNVPINTTTPNQPTPPPSPSEPEERRG